jgi:hypothetical protein
MFRALSFCALVVAACGPGDRNHGTSDGHPGGDSNIVGDGNDASYLVYAHSNTVLYTVDLQAHTLVTVGNFNAPNAPGGSTPDVITDLAVAPNGTIYVISNTALYTASATDGHVTQVGSISTCGQKGVALTTTSDGRIWMGDFMGSICQIDISGATPVVRPPVKMKDGYALSGDMVGIDNGTIFGSAYMLSDSHTQDDNILVKVDVSTGAVTPVGPTGYPRLYGVAYQLGKVFGFTHDGTGRVVTIDTTTGAGSMFATFMEQGQGISFAGAGVSSLVPQIP